MEKKLTFIDVGNMTPKQAEAVLQLEMNRYKTQTAPSIWWEFLDVLSIAASFGTFL